MSRSAVATAFNASPGGTPLGDLTTRCMHRAEVLRRDTALSLHEIAGIVGPQPPHPFRRSPIQNRSPPKPFT